MSPTTTTPSTVPSTATSVAPATTTTVAAPSSTAPPTTPAPTVHTFVRSWLLLRERLVPVHRAGETLEDAVSALLGGPNDEDLESILEPESLTTDVPSGTLLRSVSIHGGVATIDLSEAFASGGGSLSMMARLAQLVYVATEFPDVRSVALHIDGSPVVALGGEGIDVSNPLRRADFEAFKPLVIVSHPKPGDEIQSPFKVAGCNSTFENTVSLRVIATSGTVLVSTFANWARPDFRRRRTSGVGPVRGKRRIRPR